MSTSNLVYPKDWRKISLAERDRAGYTCQICNLQCLPTGAAKRSLSRSTIARLTCQTHHLDLNPGNNNPRNLLVVCSGCHLKIHRSFLGQSPGQLSLKLKLKTRRRPKIKYSQITLVHLLANLPKISTIDADLDVDRYEQLTIALNY